MNEDQAVVINSEQKKDFTNVNSNSIFLFIPNTVHHSGHCTVQTKCITSSFWSVLNEHFLVIFNFHLLNERLGYLSILKGGDGKLRNHVGEHRAVQLKQAYILFGSSDHMYNVVTEKKRFLQLYES